MKLQQLGSNKTKLVYGNGTEIFFSYDTPVAGCSKELGYFKTEQKFSRTTTKHINSYIGDRDAQTIPQRAIQLAQHQAIAADAAPHLS